MCAHYNSRLIAETFVSHYQSERPLDWDRRFGRPGLLDVEIGFGLGDFLIRKAQQEPLRNFVGIELDWLRVKKTLHKICALRQAGQFDGQVRLLQADVTVAFERFFRPQSISRIYCLFPCPWPKKGHVKHRLFSRSFTQLVNSRLQVGGEVQLVTDFYPYFRWLTGEVEESGFAVSTQTIRPQFNTKYERKWCGAGQREFYELRLVKKEHQPVPLKEDRELRVFFVDKFQPDRFVLPEVKGEITVVQKDFIFDACRGKGMVHVVVAEPSLTQHLWVVIVQSSHGWCVAKAEGQTALPTAGVVLAIEKIAEAVTASGKNENND